MEIEVTQPMKVKLNNIRVHAKVGDSGTYTLFDTNKNEIKETEGYVPSFFPEQHYGDYLILDIEIETGKILNWNVTKEQIQTWVSVVL